MKVGLKYKKAFLRLLERDSDLVVVDRRALSYLAVVRAVGRLLDTGVLLLVAHLNADHRVHVQSGQLPSLDHRYTHLKIHHIRQYNLYLKHIH